MERTCRIADTGKKGAWGDETGGRHERKQKGDKFVQRINV